eukprot:1026740-Amphidinium_carterae.2
MAILFVLLFTYCSCFLTRVGQKTSIYVALPWPTTTTLRWTTTTGDEKQKNLMKNITHDYGG